MKETQCLFGESSKTIQDSKESTVPCSGMNLRTKAVCSFNKRIQLILRSGLVCAITPTSTAKRSSQQTLDIVSGWQDGEIADTQREDC